MTTMSFLQIYSIKKKKLKINLMCHDLEKKIITYVLHHQLTIAKENSQLKIKIVIKYAD